MRRQTIVLLVVCTACGASKTDDDSPPTTTATQSFAEAMAIVCEASRAGNPGEPAQVRVAAGLERMKAVTHPEALALLAALPHASPSHLVEELAAAYQRAGLQQCRDSLGPSADFGGPLVEVGRRVQPFTPTALLVAIRTDGIYVDGNKVVKVRDGAVDGKTTDSAMGLFYPDLKKAAGKHQAPPNLSPRERQTCLIYADPSIRYDTVFATIISLRRAPSVCRRFHLPAKRGPETGVLVTDLPDFAPTRVVPTVKPKPRLQLVVSLTAKNAILWSISGDEGTLQKPKAEFELGESDRLSEVLAEIRGRHPLSADADRNLILQADPELTMAIILPWMAAAKSSKSGESLFPDVLFSLGFQ